MPDLWLLTCAPGSRAGEAMSLFESLPDVPAERRVVVTTQPDPITRDVAGAEVLLFDGTEVNISKWWAVGLDWIAARAGDGPYDVFLVESDTRIAPGDLDRVRAEMRRCGCVAAGADWLGLLPAGVTLVRRSNAAMGPATLRLPGIGMVVAGEAGLRHDQRFRWWLADDDLEWQARAAGGTALVGGTTLQHEGTTPLEGERLQAWIEDEPRFAAKWGGVPAQGGVL